MVDNTQLNARTTEGDTIATDDIDGVKFQRFKQVFGKDGVNAGDVAFDNPLPIGGAELQVLTEIRDKLDILIRYASDITGNDW